tara:strand:- start:45 stop:599 length:555 start_codon:yes stop_codon:yes gene_type:complete
MNYKELCSRCADPRGHIHYYAHVANGVCFKCYGSGFEIFKTSPEARAAARLKAAEKREAQRVAKRQAEFGARMCRNISKALRQIGWELERQKEREQAEDVAEGKQLIAGTILSTKQVEGYGYNQWVLKMLVQDDRGFKVWGTVPTSIYADAEKGTRVQFNASIQASNDDSKFGFFKRPTKAVTM